MNQNVQNSTLHNDIQLEDAQMLINSTVQSSAKIFCSGPDNKYLDSASQEAKSNYKYIISICRATAIVQSNRMPHNIFVATT